MLYLLITVSFLIHICLIVVVYQLRNQLHKLDQSNVEELKNLFGKYLKEIKQENDRIQQLLQQNKGKYKAKNQVKAPLNEEKSKRDFIKQKQDSFYPATPSLPEDQLDASLHSKALYFYDKGLTVTEIAKKLNCGKTEIELILEWHVKQ